MRWDLAVMLLLTLCAAQDAGADDPSRPQARRALDKQIQRLNDLLDETDHHPLDVAIYRSNLRRAGIVRGSDDPQAMLALAEELGSSTDVLQRHVEESRRLFTWRVVLIGLAGLCGLGLGLGIYRFYRHRGGR